MKKEVNFVFFIAILAFLIKLYVSLRTNFWSDEVSIFVVSEENSFSDLLLMKHWDVAHPQLFYIFSHFWQKLGKSVLFLRLPNLLTTFVSIFSIFYLIKDITNKKIAYLTVLLFSFFTTTLMLSFQHKPYAFSMMFFLLAMLSLQKVLRGSDRKWEIAYIIFNALAFYSDYSYVWLLLTQGLIFLFLLLTQRKDTLVKKIFFLFLISSLLILLELPIFLKNLNRAFRLESYLPVPDLMEFESYVYFLLAYFSRFYKKFYVYSVLFLTFMVFIFYFRKNKSLKNNLIFYLIFSNFFIAPLVSWIISQWNPIFVYRNMYLGSFFFIFGIPLFFYISKKRLTTFISILFYLIVIYFFARVSLSRITFFDRFNWISFKRNCLNFPKNRDGKIHLYYLDTVDHRINVLRDYYAFDYDDNINLDFDYEYVDTDELDKDEFHEIIKTRDSIIFYHYSVKNKLFEMGLSLNEEDKYRFYEFY